MADRAVDPEKGVAMRLVSGQMTPTSEHQVLLSYAADLELEVDRLRRQCQFVQQEVWDALKRIQRLCPDSAPPESTLGRLAAIAENARQLAAVVRDVWEPPGYHPAHDQVIAIAVRPLIEQVFRWQQRLMNAPQMVLRMELQSEHVEWFPARLRHILDNLISNAVKYRDTVQGDSRVTVGLRVSPNHYELRVSDNGKGMPANEWAEGVELFYRFAPARTAGLGAGLAVVRLLVEQSGGTLTKESGEGKGTTLVAVLPRYDVDDFLE